MESEAAGTDKEVAEEGDEEDSVVSIAIAIEHANESEPDEEQVRQGVDNLGRIRRGIVVLLGRQSCREEDVKESITSSHHCHKRCQSSRCTLFHAFPTAVPTSIVEVIGDQYPSCCGE